MNDVMTASIPLNFYFQKPSGLGRPHSGGVGPAYPVYPAYTDGLSAAESMADAQQKIGQAHSLAVNAASVADWTNVAQLASDGSQEVANVNQSSPAFNSIEQWVADSSFHLNNITLNPNISAADARTEALASLASADAALLEATTQPGSGGSTSGGSTSGGTTSTSSPMSTTTKVALGVVAVSAIAAGGYMVWKNMKRGRR